jgi:hypothetical protein
LARSRAPQRLPKKGFALFERSEFAKPRQSIEEHRVSRLRRDEGHGCPFLVSSFGHAKEEKENNKKRRQEFPPAAQNFNVYPCFSQPPSTARYPRCRWFPFPATPWPWPP